MSRRVHTRRLERGTRWPLRAARAVARIRDMPAVVQLVLHRELAPTRAWAVRVEELQVGTANKAMRVLAWTFESEAQRTRKLAAIAEAGEWCG